MISIMGPKSVRAVASIMQQELQSTIFINSLQWSLSLPNIFGELINHLISCFANVRLATIPSENGQAGELRISTSNLEIQHRIYKPFNKTQSETYLSIPGHGLDLNKTRFMGCDGRILTCDGYEYWLRFPSDADAIIFARYLDDLLSTYYILAPRRTSRWVGGPWTVDEVGPSDDLECRCHLVGHIRYQRDYNEEGYWEIISSYCNRYNEWLDWNDHEECSCDEDD